MIYSKISHFRVWTALAFALLALASGNSEGQTQSSTIWGPRIASQPFDTEPFYAIKVPAWVEGTVGCGYTLSVMDSVARQRAAAHGVKISEVGFVDPFFAYYDSKLLHRRSPHVAADGIKQQIAEYQRLGVRVLGVYPPCLQSEVYETRPEWRRIDHDTTEIPSVDLSKAPHGGMLCLLGPYGDFMIEVLAEILTQFPEVDAFSFDGLHYGGVCYCQFFREGYRQASGGQAIPPVECGVQALPALGRSPDGGSGAADADPTERDQARSCAGDLEHECWPIRSLSEYSAKYAFANELAARRPRSGVLAR